MPKKACAPHLPRRIACPECGASLYCYHHERPSVAADIAVFVIDRNATAPGLAALKILLIQRKFDGGVGKWALPGGFLRGDEDLLQCARRELQEEAGIEAPVLREGGVFSRPNRDERQRVVSVAHYALTLDASVALKAGTDAADAAWFDVYKNGKMVLKGLAFDHEAIIASTLEKLKGDLNDYVLLGQLYPRGFTLRQYNELYDAVQGQQGDKRNLSVRLKRWLAEGKLKEHKAPGTLEDPEQPRRGPKVRHVYVVKSARSR